MAGTSASASIVRMLGPVLALRKGCCAQHLASRTSCASAPLAKYYKIMKDNNNSNNV